MKDLISCLSALRRVDKQITKRDVIIWANEANVDYLNMTDLELYARYIEANVDMPVFLWIDLSGRGYTGEWTLADILDADNELGDTDASLHEWANDCNVGDTWANRTDKYIRTK